MPLEGNQFWKLRASHGRKRLFETPELLWEAACEYFQWCDEHPWIASKKKKKGDDYEETEETPTARPYTITGLLFYVDASASYWKEAKKNSSTDFLLVMENIEKIIQTQQFEGAMVGAYSNNLVARLNGLSDKQEVNSTSQVKASIVVNCIDSAVPLAGSEDEVE
ncbi:MAG: DNA packaging protein [Chloroflexi bacterium]|nr:DNA packaging protein [Chloroflexota bacterium]